MADTKITALTALTAADPINDVIPIVDVSDNSITASGTTKKISVNNLLSSSPTASGALTVSGLVTAGSATITGAATVGTTLGVTGASTLTGSVGIGAASSAKLSVVDTNGIPIRFGDLTAAPASQTACFVGVSTSAFSGNGNGDLILVPRTTDNRDVVIYTGSGTAAERLRVTAAGNVNITTGNVVMATSGKGIDFGATTEAAGMTSELLNDYEEGTWVPSISSGATAVTYGTQLGSYTKVGRLVTVVAHLSTNSATVNGSQLTIAGLPFSVPNFGAGVVAYNNTGFVSTPSGNKPNLYLSGSNIDFYTSSGSAFLGTSLGDDAFDVRFTATYFA